MKTTRLYTAILSLMVPALVFSLGLGEIRVDSFLNQPFKAEIPLLDAEGVSLNGIKVTLGSLEEFERAGIPLDDVLSLFKFEVKRGRSGHPVVEISSQDRVTEPFLQILVDMAWANGQLYRSYTVLLDPPGYKLVTPVKQIKPVSAYHSGAEVVYGSGAVRKDIYEQEIKQPVSVKKMRKEATYGPTIASENIWQIAQHYSTPDASLPQIILAIVGTNSQAFTQGNLNGLKVGERLRIPSNEEVLKVPANLAKQEVEAHDVAWKTRQEIKHVLLPPYINGETGVSQFGKTTDLGSDTTADSQLSQVPSFWKPELQTPVVSPELKISPPVVKPAPPGENPANNKLLSYIPSVPASEPVRKENIVPVAEPNLPNTETNSENSVLKQQMKDLALKNNELKKEVEQQSTEFKALRQQIQTLAKGNSSQAAQPAIPSPASSPDWWMYLLLLLGGTSVAYWFWSKRNGKDSPEQAVSQLSKAGSTEAPVHEEKTSPVIISIPEDEPVSENLASVTSSDTKSPDVTADVSEERIKVMESPAISLITPVAGISKTTPADSPEERDVTEEAPEVIPEFDVNGNTPVNFLEEPDVAEETSAVISEGDSSVSTPLYSPEIPNVADENPVVIPEADVIIHSPVDFREESVGMPEEIPVIQPEADLGDSMSLVLAPEPVNLSELKTDTSDKTLEDEGNTNSESLHLVDFEPGLDKLIVTNEVPEATQDLQADSSMDFEQLSSDYLLEEYSDVSDISPPDEIPAAESSNNQPHKIPRKGLPGKAPKLAKSKAALDTLLALAKTYVSMDDFETARQSLEEVLNFGSERQKSEAQAMLDEIRDK